MIKSLFAALALALLSLSQAHALTAFEAVALARREVNDVAKKSLVQIYGKHGSIGVYPVEWKILFYDPYADQQGTQVTVAGNVITEIAQGYTQMDKFRLFAYKEDEVLTPKRLKVDSKDIVPALSRSSAFKDVKITSVDLWLRKEGKGTEAPGVWNVTLFAMNQKNEEVEFGKAKINAETAQIIELKSDLKKLARK